MTADNDFVIARREAVDAVVTVLERDLGMEPAEALALLAGAGDLRVGQSMGGAIPMTLRLEIPKWDGRAPGAREGAGEVRRVIVDVHSHIMWYPDHVGEQWAKEALASKLVKLKFSGGLAHAAALDLHSYDSTPETHWEAAQQTDKTIVFGLQAKATGTWVPNELIADYAKAAPGEDRRLGLGRPQRARGDRPARPRGQRARPARPEARAGVPALRPDRPEALAVLRGRAAPRDPDHLAPGDDVPVAGQAALVHRALARGHRDGLPRPADDRGPPRPSVGGGPRRADPQGAEHVRRHQRGALPAVALLAGDGHGDGVRRDAQAAARVGFPVRRRSTTSSTACGGSTTSSRGRGCRRSRRRSRTGSSTRTGRTPCRSLSREAARLPSVTALTSGKQGPVTVRGRIPRPNRLRRI